MKNNVPHVIDNRNIDNRNSSILRPIGHNFYQKILFLGDSQAHKCGIILMKYSIQQKFDTFCLFKFNANLGKIVEVIVQLAVNFTKTDYVILLDGIK